MEKPREDIIVSKTMSNNNFYIALLLGAIVLFLGLGALLVFQFNILETFILFLAIIVIYAAALRILLEPNTHKEVRRTFIESIEKPIVHEVKVEGPTREVIREVEKPVYFEHIKPKLDIKRYNYVGSSETKTYHTRNCRLGKLIKKKFKLMDDSPAFFKSKNFKPCKVCIKKKSK